MSVLARLRRQVRNDRRHFWQGCDTECHCADIAQALAEDDYGHDPDMCCRWCSAQGLPPYDARVSGALPGEGHDL